MSNTNRGLSPRQAAMTLLANLGALALFAAVMIVQNIPCLK